MAFAGGRKGNIRLPPEVNRILYIKNLPFKITSDEMYDIFGKYGAIRQIRLGNTPETRGTAYVIYEDIFDAKQACDHLSGFNVCDRYLVVLYYQPSKAYKAADLEKQQEEIDKLKSKYGLATPDVSGQQGWRLSTWLIADRLIGISFKISFIKLKTIEIHYGYVSELSHIDVISAFCCGFVKATKWIRGNIRCIVISAWIFHKNKNWLIIFQN